MSNPARSSEGELRITLTVINALVGSSCSGVALNKINVPKNNLDNTTATLLDFIAWVLIKLFFRNRTLRRHFFCG